ncbi:hypothetical protein HYW94_00015 [Candidatus Uhrbacteria bacterium]|nr:hypothetical protein [Candidatus Uhrbacteria bacterium]
MPDPRVEVHYGVDSIDVMAEEFIVCRLCFAKRREGSDFFVFEERESVWFSCEEHKVDYAEEDACKHECSDLKRHIQIDREYHENPDRLKYSAADWSPESIAKFVAEHKECYNS